MGKSPLSNIRKGVQRVTLARKKIELYDMLLSLDASEMTPEEVDIAFSLAKDRDIQAVLEKARGKVNRAHMGDPCIYCGVDMDKVPPVHA